MQKKIRVAFDAQSILGNKTGIGVYTDSVVKAMQVLMPNDIEVDFISTSAAARYAGDMRTPRRLEWEVFAFPKLARNHDLVHVPGFAMGWQKPKTILTVHDLIGITFTNQVGAASRLYWGQWLPWAAKRADHIITVSEYTRYDLIRLLRIQPSRISVIYPSGHEDYSEPLLNDPIDKLKKRYNLDDSFFLSVGTSESRKNLDRVMLAHQLLRKRVPGSRTQLVIVGSQILGRGKPFANSLHKAELPLTDVIFTGYLSIDELRSLYRHAVALVYPSLYEGFGLPVLEAMGARCPVITSRISSIPEVAGDAALYVDAGKIDSITNALEVISSDQAKRNELIAAGQTRMRLFSWKKTAAQIFDVYRKVYYGN